MEGTWRLSALRRRELWPPLSPRRSPERERERERTVSGRSAGPSVRPGWRVTCLIASRGRYSISPRFLKLPARQDVDNTPAVYSRSSSWKNFSKHLITFPHSTPWKSRPSRDVTFHQALQHAGVEALRDPGAGRVHTGIRVDFDQPNGQILGDHEVGAVKFEAATPPLHVILRRQHHHDDGLRHLRVNEIVIRLALVAYRSEKTRAVGGALNCLSCLFLEIRTTRFSACLANE